MAFAKYAERLNYCVEPPLRLLLNLDFIRCLSSCSEYFRPLHGLRATTLPVNESTRRSKRDQSFRLLYVDKAPKCRSKGQNGFPSWLLAGFKAAAHVTATPPPVYAYTPKISCPKTSFSCCLFVCILVAHLSSPSTPTCMSLAGRAGLPPPLSTTTLLSTCKRRNLRVFFLWPHFSV